MKKNRIINAGTLIILSLTVVVVGSLEYILLKKKSIDKTLIRIAQDSSSIEEVSEKLENFGYENYRDGNKLMVKVKGIWNTFYCEKYLSSEDEEIESSTMYKKGDK